MPRHFTQRGAGCAAGGPSALPAPDAGPARGGNRRGQPAAQLCRPSRRLRQRTRHHHRERRRGRVGGRLRVRSGARITPDPGRPGVRRQHLRRRPLAPRGAGHHRSRHDPVAAGGVGAARAGRDAPGRRGGAGDGGDAGGQRGGLARAAPARAPHRTCRSRPDARPSSGSARRPAPPRCAASTRWPTIGAATWRCGSRPSSPCRNGRTTRACRC